MKKIIILVLFICLLTGCSVKYNLVINEDLSIYEEAKLTGTSDFFANYYKTTKKNVLKSFLDIYEEILKDNKYEYELVEENTPYVNVSKKYNNIDEYINNTVLLNKYFDEIKYTHDGKIDKIETIGFNDDNPLDPDRFDVKELTITIKCPYVVKNHNADKIDKKTNTYYFDLNKDNKILIEYDTRRKFNPNTSIIKTIIVCLLMIICLWTTIIVLNKKNKKK